MYALAARFLTAIPPRVRPPESVGSYPIEPRVEAIDRHLLVMHSGQVIAETRRPLRLIRAGHPPLYTFTAAEVRTELLGPATCLLPPVAELGEVRWHDVRVARRRAPQAAWSIGDARPGIEALAGRFAFFAGRLDTVLVDDEPVIAQPGGRLPGWITGELTGPFAS